MIPSILLVDDDEFARSFVRAVIERAGWAVEEVETVGAALSAMERTVPNVVVTDWHLPDGNGADLARQLQERSAGLPVILITGDAVAVDSCGSTTAGGFSAILQKPFSPTAMVEAIRTVLGGGTGN